MWGRRKEGRGAAPALRMGCLRGARSCRSCSTTRRVSAAPTRSFDAWKQNFRAAGSVKDHFLTSYERSMMAVLAAQFGRKSLMGGKRGVIDLTKSKGARGDWGEGGGVVGREAPQAWAHGKQGRSESTGRCDGSNGPGGVPHVERWACCPAADRHEPLPAGTRAVLEKAGLTIEEFDRLEREGIGLGLRSATGLVDCSCGGITNVRGAASWFGDGDWFSLP